MKFLHLNYHCHLESNSPDWVIQKHKFTSGFIDYLKKKVDLISVKHLDFEGAKEVDDIAYYFFRRKNKFRQIPFKTHRFIKKQSPDVVLIEGFVFPLQTMALRWKLGKNCVIIWQHHGESPWKGLKGFFQKLAARTIDGYLFSSVGNAKKWVDKKIISKEKCFEVIAASTTFRSKNKLESATHLGLSGKPNFLWVGRLISIKDPITILKAFSKYCYINRDARLYMIYQDEELVEQVKQIIAQEDGLKTAVRLIGKKENEELEDWYNAADFFILGSHREASGYALVEAMSCGCIPVVTDIPSFKKITANGAYGFHFKVSDANDLAERILSLETLDQKAWSKKISLYAQKEFSFEKIADQIYDIALALAQK